VHRFTKLVEGEAKGADRMARDWADMVGIPVARYPITPAEWSELGNAAGPIRNQRMLELEQPERLRRRNL
jgi:hypothetical protein